MTLGHRSRVQQSPFPQAGSPLLGVCSAGGSLGALSHAIVVDQFTRLRDGDSWWYENPGVLDPATLSNVKGTSWVRYRTHLHFALFAAVANPPSPSTYCSTHDPLS
jgi:hypothetical protein